MLTKRWHWTVVRETTYLPNCEPSSDPTPCYKTTSIYDRSVKPQLTVGSLLVQSANTKGGRSSVMATHSESTEPDLASWACLVRALLSSMILRSSLACTASMRKLWTYFTSSSRCRMNAMGSGTSTPSKCAPRSREILTIGRRSSRSFPSRPNMSISSRDRVEWKDPSEDG